MDQELLPTERRHHYLRYAGGLTFLKCSSG